MPFLEPCNAVSCHFDKTPSVEIILFELLVIVGGMVILWLLSRYLKRVWLHAGIMLLGVLIFEIFTSPMWNNFKMGWWAYVYRDVSWILSLGWTVMILTIVTVTDFAIPKLVHWKRFAIYLMWLTVMVTGFESIVVSLGIRTYAPEVLEVFSPWKIANVQLEVLYYVPAFCALIISFYKYWLIVFEKKLVVPRLKPQFGINLLVSFIGVLLYELMIEPMAVNVNFPIWSYIYRDISIVMSGAWILIIWTAITVVDFFLMHMDLFRKFIAYIVMATVLALPMEALLMICGFRQYQASSVDNFSGFTIPLLNVPVEVGFAIPFYLFLVVAFIKYWLLQSDIQKVKHEY